MSSELRKSFCPDKDAVHVHLAYERSLPNRFGIIKKPLTGEKLSGFFFSCFFIHPVLFLFASRTFQDVFSTVIVVPLFQQFALLSVFLGNLLESVFFHKKGE